jgi:mono/diheme cytochrome c family protein
VAVGSPLPGRPAPALNATQADGKAVYAANCAPCHGERGEGQPEWKSQRDDGTYPAPPHDETGHTWHHADGLLFNIVKRGGGYAAPVGYKSTMPAWGDKLTDTQIVAVLECIKTFWEPWERTQQATVSIQNPYPPTEQR